MALQRGAALLLQVLLLCLVVALATAQTPTEGQLGTAVQVQLPAGSGDWLTFVAYTLPSSVDAAALVIESSFAPSCSDVELALWRSSPFLLNTSVPNVQPDYSQDAVDLAYVLPSDAGGSWYVGFAHNGPSVCDLNLTAWVEPVRMVDWGEAFVKSDVSLVGEWTYFSLPIPVGTPPSSLAIEYRANPSSCASQPTLYLRRHALPTLLESDAQDAAWVADGTTIRRLTFDSAFLANHTGTWYVGALGTASCNYTIAVVGTANDTLVWDARTVGSIEANGTAFYRVDDLTGQCDYACRVLLVRLEADQSEPSCFGSNLQLQLNQGSVPTATARVTDVQRDYTEAEPSVQAMLYPVTLSNASAYYLGITNQANATCGYNITARLDDLVALNWSVPVNGSLKPAFWDYFSFTLIGALEKFTATLTLDSAACTTPPTLNLRRNGFPTLLRWDHRINTTQTVNGTTVLAFSGDASQMLAGQWYVGVWGAQAAGQEACPYSLTVSKNEAISLPLGVDNTFSAQGQFTHYYSFGLSDVPPLLEIEVGADPASCPTLPKVGLSFMVYPTVNASNFGNWSTSAEGVQTLIVPSQYLAPGTYFLGVFGQSMSDNCSYVIHASTTTNTMLPFDVTTPGVANASSVVYYQLGQLANNRVLLVRLEADASLSACYGSNLVMQLNVNTLPTLTNFLPSAQRDFSDPGSAVAAQAMVFSVPVPDGTYYLGLFGNSPSSACPYDITARMEYLDYLEWGEVGEGSLRPANWHYYSINVETAPLKFQVNLTVLDLTQCPSPPTLYLRLNAYPNLIHADYMLNASQMVGNSIIFTSDPSQISSGQWNVGLWGTQGSQDARCNYQLSIHQSAADALTFGPPFSDTVEGNAPNYYSFVLAGTFSSSLTLFLGTANDMECTEAPRAVLSLNAYPTLDQHDYPGPANWTVNPDGTQTLSIPQQQLQQGTYYMGVFGSGNGSCSYLIRLTSTTDFVLPWDTITPSQVDPGNVSYYKLSPADNSKAILVRVLTNPNETNCMGSFLVLKMNPDTLPTATSRLDGAQRDFSDPFDPVAAQDLIYGVQVNNRTFYVGLFNNGTSVCSYNISARMENLAVLAPGTFMQGVSRPLYWDYYTFDVGGEYDGISAQLTYDANCTTPPGLYLRRNAFPSRVRSDYGPASTVTNGTVISFTGNASVAQPGAWRLGVFGENSQSTCPYTIALQLNQSSDPHLDLGVVYTQSSTSTPFADYFMFAITAIPPELIVQVMADPEQCPTMPRPLVRLGLEPTSGEYDFGQFVRSGNMLVLNLTTPVLQLGTYYLGVYGNASCTYSVKAFTQTHNTLPLGPVLTNQVVVPPYSFYALDPLPSGSVLILRVVTTTPACQDPDTLSLFLQKNTLATKTNQIIDLQKDVAGPALDIVYGVAQTPDYDPLTTRFFASVYSVAAEACVFNISARLQNTTTLTLGQPASDSVMAGYWSYFKMTFVSHPTDLTLEITTANCPTQPSPFLRRQSYPTRVLSDFGPDAFTASGTGGDQSRLSFSGNATALRSGTYYLGVFGTGTGGCSFTVVANSNQPNVTTLALDVNMTGTTAAQGWTYYSLTYTPPVRGVLNVNLDIAAGAPATCTVPAVRVLINQDVLPDLNKFLASQNDNTSRSEVEIYRTVTLGPIASQTYYVGVYNSLTTGSCAYHLTAHAAPLGVLPSAGTQMMGASSASPSWSYYLVDLTTMAPQPELLYLLYNSTTGCAQQPRVHLRKQYFPNAIASDYQFTASGTSQTLALNQTQLNPAAKWYVGVYGASCNFTISALAQSTIPSSVAGSPTNVSSPPKAWSFYSVTLAASRKRADSGVGASTPQVLVVEAAGGCASALDVYVRQGTYPTIASFDGSSTQFRGGPNNTIVLVNGTQDAWSQGGSWYVGIYNRDSSSCAFTLSSQFDASIDLAKLDTKLSGSVTAGGYWFFYYTPSKSATYYAHLASSTSKGSLSLYARSAKYPTRYEFASSTVWKGSEVQAAVSLKNGQSGYFAVYNPTATNASFTVRVDSSGSNTDDGSSKTALWVILGIALGILGISALAFVVYSIIKQKPWIRRFSQMGSSSSRRYSLSTRYRPLVNDEESASLNMLPLSGVGRTNLDEPLLQGESEGDNDAL